MARIRFPSLTKKLEFKYFVQTAHQISNLHPISSSRSVQQKEFLNVLMPKKNNFLSLFKHERRRKKPFILFLEKIDNNKRENVFLLFSLRQKSFPFKRNENFGENVFLFHV